MGYLLHDIFIDTVKKRPNKKAVIEESGRAITYRALNELANQFAHYFHNAIPSIRKNPFVGILSPVHIRSIAAILGALKVGCAYVPLDDASPYERLDYIVKNTKLELVVVDEKLYEKHRRLLHHPLLKIVLILNDEQSPKELRSYSTQNPIITKQVSDDLAYVLHSSGSTGVPKGIMLTHRNARTFVDWMHKEFQVTKEDIIMSRAPFKFDLSVFDIFDTFKAGASLICFDWLKQRESNKHVDYVKLMEKEQASILYTTPSTFITLMNSGQIQKSVLKLRVIMYAGEPFAIPQLRKLQTILPKTKIANIYGPTETNIITYYWIDTIPASDDSHIPLGSVVDDTEIIVVSEDDQHLCNPNEVGELWCRGGTVTLGYLGMSEQTKACLVNSPFHPYATKFWRTGDYGFRDEEGLLHYRGRKDHMVKVKGYRIELGEVELAIAKHPQIALFCVVAIRDEKYGNRLYCFYSSLNKKPIEKIQWEQFLMQKLPEYMIPYKFIYRESLPKTSSEKVDRILLAQQIETDKAYVT